MTKMKVKFELDLGRERHEKLLDLELPDGWKWDEIDRMYEAWRDDLVEQHWTVVSSYDMPDE